MTGTSGTGPSLDWQQNCVVCGALIPADGHFCPNCGTPRTGAQPQQQWPLYPRRFEEKDWRVTVKALMSIGMLSFVGFLCISLVALIYGIDFVSGEIVNAEHSLVLVTPLLIPILTLKGGVLLAYYYLLVAAIFVSSVWFFFKGASGFAKELTQKAKSREHSPIFEVAGLLFAVLFFNTFVVLLVKGLGGDVESSAEEVDLWEMLFLLANASVWEEVVSRLLLIGVPLILVDLVRRKTRPKLLSYLLGGGFDLRRPELVLLVLSSTIFGLGHVFGGWGLWKVPPTIVTGLALGYLFLRYGLAVSIVLHFGINYMQMPMSVFDSFTVEIITALAALLWLGLGLVMFTYYSSRVVEYFTGSKLLEPAPRPAPVPWTYTGYPQWNPQAPPPSPTAGWTYYPPSPGFRPPTSGFGWGYVCPVCGYPEARWLNGKFQCLRCGHLSQ